MPETRTTSPNRRQGAAIHGALAVPAVIAVLLNRYIVNGLLTGSVK
jgi:ABC-type glycerol-3-phosphate transport system permease component